MRINTNISAINAYGNLSKVQDELSSSMQKLSSGFRINKAGDDAAGLGIANQLAGSIGAMQQASSNADQASSVLQIMDGATQNLQSILERMKELAAESGSDTVDSTARTKINNEFQSLSQEVDRIVNTTKFQGQNLLDGTYGSLSTANGAVASGSSIFNAHVTNVAATNSATVAGLAGNVTASIVKKDNVLAANFNSGVALTVTSQATVNSLSASSAVSVSSVTQGTTTFGTYTAGTGGTNLSSVSVGPNPGDTATSNALKAGTWTVTTAHNSGTPANEDITITNGSQSFQVQNVVPGSSSSIYIAGAGVDLNFGAAQTQAQLDNLSGATFKVTQNYNVQVTGGGVSGGQTAAVADNGTAQTASFSNYGFSFQVASGTESTFAGKAIGLTEEDQLQLSDGTTTQALDLGASPAGQTYSFSKLGLSVTLSGTATAANLATDFAASNNTIQRSVAHQAEFLVSASQSYSTNDLIDLGAVKLDSTTLGVNTSQIDLTTASGAQSALSSIDGAIATLGNALGSIGAAENRISYASTNVKTAIQNYTAAESTIKDVDMASEMTNFSKEQIMVQAGTAMLAQANQLGASVLKLLQ